MSAWTAAGLLLAFATAAAAATGAMRATPNAYAGGVYGMTRRTHAAYAVTSLLSGAGFAASFAVSAIPVFALLAVQTLVSVFYAASYLRGFSDEE